MPTMIESTPPCFDSETEVSPPRDIVSPSVRSHIMRSVARRDTEPERLVRSALRSLGKHCGYNVRSLPGSPDLANRRKRWAIFVHGCFWHGHRNCKKTKGGRNGRIPASNRSFWEPKLAQNRERDARKVRDLRKIGFRVLTVWECQARDPRRLERLLIRFLGPDLLEEKRSDAG
jgi:DNA mismatch endonuclease (patch repair protein)